MYVGLYHRSHGSCVKGIGRSGLQYRSKPRNRDGEWDRGRENDSADMRHTHTTRTSSPRSDQFFGYFQATEPLGLDRVKWCAALFLKAHVEHTLWFYRGINGIMVNAAQQKSAARFKLVF